MASQSINQTFALLCRWKQTYLKRDLCKHTNNYIKDISTKSVRLQLKHSKLQESRQALIDCLKITHLDPEQVGHSFFLFISRGLRPDRVIRSEKTEKNNNGGKVNAIASSSSALCGVWAVSFFLFQRKPFEELFIEVSPTKFYYCCRY